MAFTASKNQLFMSIRVKASAIMLSECVLSQSGRLKALNFKCVFLKVLDNYSIDFDKIFTDSGDTIHEQLAEE